MHLEMGFMFCTDAEKDLAHRPVLDQDMEYTRTVSRTLRPNLERKAKTQAAPPVGAQRTKRPREGFTQAEQQGDWIRLDLSQGDTVASGGRTSSMRRTMSPRPLSKDLGDIGKVGTTYDLCRVLNLTNLISYRYTIHREVTAFYQPRLLKRTTRLPYSHGTGSCGQEKRWRWA